MGLFPKFISRVKDILERVLALAATEPDLDLSSLDQHHAQQQ